MLRTKNIKFNSSFCIKGEMKIGIDSGVIICLIDNPFLFTYQASKVFDRKGLFFTHERNVIESKRVLVRDYNFGEERAEKELKEFLDRHNIKIIPKDYSNADLAIERMKIVQKHGINLNPPDHFIISDFIESGINRIFSTDKNFIEACNILGINAERLIFNVDREIKKQLTKLKRF